MTFFGPDGKSECMPILRGGKGMTALNDFCSANRWVAWRPEQRDGKWTKLP